MAKASTWHMETPSRMMSFWATTRVFKTSVAAENCHTTAACSRQCALLEVQKADPKSLGSIWLNLFTDYSHVNPFAKFANKTAVFRHAPCWNFTNGPESFSAITWRMILLCVDRLKLQIFKLRVLGTAASSSARRLCHCSIHLF